MADRDLAEAIASALAEAVRGRAHDKLFVKVERIRRRRSLEPTENQAKLLDYIETKGSVPWEWSLGMHWGVLGGLMARGLVVEDEKAGKRVLRSRSASEKAEEKK